MVNAVAGSLLTCSDAATLQYVLFLENEGSLGKSFVYQKLDETHLFVDSAYVDQILAKIDEFSDRNAYELDRGNNSKDSAKPNKAKR
ncbi:RNA polymerase II transcription factor B subunit 5 [Hondaea fermentalgiana]|uniref:General transcription and DNA repair factor IIH subunit TFB5 n=1 Tax=Hondaea fermentalgiana TaxID=2315210 RepID=A0A2R5GWW8_9STRA|nr:RNA polymerase II transcription factor B subunit 5 [Hondaea fermentalgiana]|eukprot:GBG32434.1 RNA polymerase II transcription factor B subunit 5 [Hondaea fermentalgiana]